MNLLRITVVTLFLSFVLGNDTVIFAQNYPEQTSNQSEAVATRIIRGNQIKRTQNESKKSTSEVVQVAYLSKTTTNPQTELEPDFPKTPGMNYVKIVNDRGETVYVPEEYVNDYKQQFALSGNSNSVQNNITINTVIQNQSVTQPAQKQEKSNSLLSFFTPFERKTSSKPATSNSVPATEQKQNTAAVPSNGQSTAQPKNKFSLKSLFIPSTKDKNKNIVTTTPAAVPTPAAPAPTLAPPQSVSQSNIMVQGTITESSINSQNHIQNSTIENPFAKPDANNSVYMNSAEFSQNRSENIVSSNSNDVSLNPDAELPFPDLTAIASQDQSVASQMTLEPVPEDLLPDELPIPAEPELKPSIAQLEPIPGQEVPLVSDATSQSSKETVTLKPADENPIADVPAIPTTDNLTFPLDPVEPEPVVPATDPVATQPQIEPTPDVELPETDSPVKTKEVTKTDDSAVNALQLEILGPKEIEFGKNEKFTLVVSNSSNSPMSNLTLRVYPQGFGEDKTATIKIDKLLPNQSRRVAMTLNAQQMNKLSLMAKIENEGGIVTQKEIAIAVKNGKIKIKILPPTHNSDVGDKAQYTVRLINQSDKDVKVNVVIFFSEGLEPEEVQGFAGVIQKGQINPKMPLELKGKATHDIFVTAIASGEGVYKTLVQLTDLQGNTYTVKNNCTFGRLTLPAPLDTKSDEDKTLESSSTTSKEVSIQDNQAAPLPQDLGVNELPEVKAMDEIEPDVQVPDIPTTDIPTTDIPTTDIPTTDIPTTDIPTTDIPTTDIPTTDIPTTDIPTMDIPTTDIPTTDIPTTDIPVPDVPKTEEKAPEKSPEKTPSESAELPEPAIPNAPLPSDIIPNQADENESDSKNDDDLIMSDFLK